MIVQEYNDEYKLIYDTGIDYYCKYDRYLYGRF